MQRAGDALFRIRGAVQKFHSSEYINALANGDICLAVGYSGDILQAKKRAEEAKNKVKVAYGGVTVCRKGVASMHDANALGEIMAAPYIEIVADLGLGKGEGVILTNDLTHAYIDENMGTS